MMKKHIVFSAAAALLTAVLSVDASAQESSAMAFGRVSHDPAAMAMGGAGTA